MAGVQKSKDWQATAMPQFAGRSYSLTVTGLVQVTATNQTPKLTERVPQGANRQILLLDLSIVSSGGSSEPIDTYKFVSFNKSLLLSPAYEEVDILVDGKATWMIRVVYHRKVKAATTAKKKPAPMKRKAAATKRRAKK